MNSMITYEKEPCPRCGRKIDQAARVCPFCGADTESGAVVDEEERQVVEEVFGGDRDEDHPLLIFYRKNQQIILILGLLVAIGALLGVTAMMSGSGEREVQAVPLSELTTPPDQERAGEAPEMPEPEFTVPGNAETFETFLTEEGAVAPERDDEADSRSSGVGSASGDS